MAVEARRKEAREEERLLKLLAGGLALATIAVVLQLFLSRLFARPAPAPAPVYDYVIDIYADKVVITASDGTTTTLNTVADLNSWLRNVRDKRIRINANVVVTSDLRLTSNEYWVFGEWINTNVYVAEPNTTIVSFAPLGNAWGGYYVSNMSPDTGEYVDASGFKLFAVYADVDIETPYPVPPPTYMPVTIVVLSSGHTKLHGVESDVLVQGYYLEMVYCRLRNAYIDVIVATLQSCDASGGHVVLIIREYTSLSQVDFSGAKYFTGEIRFYRTVFVNPGQSVNINVPVLASSMYHYVFVENMGMLYASPLPSGVAMYFLAPLPSGVTYSVDAPNKRIVITNSTGESITVIVVYRLVVNGFFPP
jgi:hypothetical protein